MSASANWVKQKPEMIRHYLMPKTFLGEEDAKNEWINNGEPHKLFLHTEGYINFKLNQVLFLFGRRGTGKTAMMQMLRYEIRNRKTKEYTYVWLVDQEDAYHDLAIQIRMSPLSQLPPNELVHLLKKKWSWVITTSAMCSVVIQEEQTDNENLRIIKDYLKSQNLIQRLGVTGPLNVVSDILSEELISVDCAPFKIAAAIARVTKRLLSTQYYNAKKSLSEFLSENSRSCLVMIDSIEKYNLSDKISDSVASALIDSSLEFYVKRKTDRIYPKIAFPSEVFPHLSPSNQEKMEGKILFILWTYKDLVSLLAKRYYKLLLGIKEVDIYEELVQYEHAISFLYRFMPSKIKTDSGILFDTIAYIMRHTHKKPRQAILLLNIILTLSEKKNLEKTQLTEECIKEGVHSRLDILVNGAMHIYDQIYPKAVQLIRRTLIGARSCFTYPELDIMFKESISLRVEANLSKDNVRELFTQSSVVGLLDRKGKINGISKTIIEGLFDYQIKGTIQLSNDSICVIHPMFYQELQIEVDMDSLVYPKPAEDVEKEVLEKHGILLR